jgi:hypothetical protein
MNLSPTFDASKKQGWLALAGLVSLPVYVLPVGIWGVRALRPRLLRDFAKGSIALGMVSLVGLSLSGLARLMTSQPSTEGRWKLSGLGSFMAEEVAASAASGH